MNREPTNATSDRSRNWHDRLEVIADLMQQNLTVTEIGRRVGLSEWRVRRSAYDHGLTRPADAGAENGPLRKSRFN